MESEMKIPKNLIELEIWDFIFLLLFYPILSLGTYIVNLIIGYKAFETPVILELIVLLFLLIKSRYDWTLILIFIYALTNAYYFGHPFGMIPITLAFYSLYLFSNVRIKGDVSAYDNFIIPFAYVFVFLYLITAFINGKTVDDSSAVEVRTYYHGFIVAHAFSYYTAILGYYITKRKSIWQAIPIFIAGILVGARSGWLLNFFSILACFNLSHLFFIFRRIVRILFYATLVLILVEYEDISMFLVNYFNAFNAADLIQYSNGRTGFWFLGINEIFSQNFFSSEMLVGRGATSSFDFLEHFVGLRVWFHNDWIEILFSFGILGLLIYVFFLYNFVKKTHSMFLLCFGIIAASVNGFIFYDTLFILLLSAAIVSFQKKSVVNE